MELRNYLLVGLGNLSGLPRNRLWDPLRLRTIHIFFVEANGLKAGSDKSKPASEPTGVTKPAMVVEASEVPHCE
jgi:hypothetical protein